MAVIDRHEALRWTVHWSILSSRAKSLEPLHGSCFTSTFVLFSLAGVRLFCRRSAFVSDEVLSLLYEEDAAVNSSVWMLSTVTTSACSHAPIQVQGARAKSIVTVTRRLNFITLRCVIPFLCVTREGEKDRQNNTTN